MKKEKETNTSSHLIIGAGGIAAWLVPLLKRTLAPQDQIRVMDGDLLETRNLDRQLFSPEYIGWNKAEALGELYSIQWDPSYLQRDHWLLTHPQSNWSTIWCCADNHPARVLVLELVDEGKSPLAIIGGNEYTDSEAYAYQASYKGTSSDPRIFYAELLLDQSNNPLDPFACQGQAQRTNPQLALANYLAAGFMVHLWWFITNHGAEVRLENWPKLHQSNFAQFNTRHL